MRAFIVALMFFAAATQLAAAAPGPDPSIQTAIDARTAAMPGGGIIIGVLDHGVLTVYTSGSTGTDRPLDQHTLFEIGSVTKTFTATILMKMALAGRVKLTDPVSKYLPATVHVPSKDGHAITLLNLATQHSGLPRLPTNFKPKDQDDPYADYTKQNLYAFLNAYQLTRDPGSAYEYSNVGVGLLGVALANRAGTPYANLLSTQILEPLGMNETAIVLTPAERARFAVGHDADGTVVKPWTIDALAGAGAIRSTLADMLVYLKCNLGQGPLAGACLGAQTPRDTFAGHKIGLAWYSSTATGAIEHGGDTAGYHAEVIMSADRTTGVVALSNGPQVADIATHIVVPGSPIAALGTAATLTNDQLDEYVGKYRNDAGPIAYTVYRTGNKLYAQIAGQGPAVIYPSRADHFYYKIVAAYIEFVRQNGKVVGLILTQDGQTMPVYRLDAAGKPMATALVPAYPPVAQLDAQTMGSYAGTYRAAGGGSFVATVKDGHLFMQLSGQQPYEIYPSAKDEFYYKIVDAQVSFHRDAAGTVTSLTLHQNGRDTDATKTP